MHTIWKHELIPLRANVIETHADAQFVAVGLDPRGALCAWSLAHRGLPENRRYTINVVGTGHELPDGVERHTYLGMVVQGAFAWHCFLQADA